MNEPPAVLPPSEPPALVSVTWTEPEPPAPLAPVLSSTLDAFVVRGFAYYLDSTAVSLFCSILNWAVGQWLPAVLATQGWAWETTGAGESQFGVTLALMFLPFVYYVIFEWLYGATPMKVLFGRRVIMTDGSPCHFRAAVVRGVWRLIDGIVFGLVAYRVMKGPLQQRWGDRQANTLVVRAHDPFIRQPRPLYRFFGAAGLFFGLALIVSVGLFLLPKSFAPRDQLYAQRPAVELNLTAAEVGRAYELQSDAPLDLTDPDLRETSERLFVSTRNVVLARVFVFNGYLSDTETTLAEFGQKLAKNEIGAVSTFSSAGKPGCGDQVSLQTFSGADDGRKGFVVALVKRNVLVSILSYGEPAALNAWDVSFLACTIAKRIR